MVDFIIIPMTAILVSAAFGAVGVAWDSDRRASRSMGALFLCIGGWALVDLLTYMETDPVRALAWIRWAHLPVLMIGPSLLWVVAQMLPQSRGRLEHHARFGAVGCFLIGMGAAFLPDLTVGMVPTDFGGWMPRYGSVAIVLMPMGTVLPVYAAYEATRIEARAAYQQSDARRAWGLRVSVVLSLLIAMPTEYILPLLEIPVPRLGAFSASFAAAVVWLAVLHDTEDLLVTPRGVARALLEELHDGVALVALDGMILSSNARFAELANREGDTFLGMHLSNVIDAPFEALRDGIEDRESVLRMADGAHIPISLSSSIAKSPMGKAIGIVVVVRDRREIDMLRTQLLSAGRLAAIGELAAGIAHEVNNPVAFIRSDLNLLKERVEEVRTQVRASPSHEDSAGVLDRAHLRVERALLGVERVAEVVVDVREFAHVGGARQGGSDPESVIEGAMRLARMHRGDEVELRVANVAGSDRIDSGQELKQILLSVLRPLAAMTSKGGRIDVDLRTDEQSVTIGLSATPLSESVADVRDRFELLGASDLGLASAGELLEQLDGRLSLDDLGATGLRLEVEIPRFARGAED